MPPMFENKSQPKFVLVSRESGRFINAYGEVVLHRCNAIEFPNINAVVNWVRREDLAIEVKVMREDVVMVPTATLTEV